MGFFKVSPRIFDKNNNKIFFKRHGIQRLLEKDTDKKKIPTKKFKDYPIGYFHIDITEVRTEEGKQQMYVAVDSVRF